MPDHPPRCAECAVPIPPTRRLCATCTRLMFIAKAKRREAAHG